MRCHTSAPTIVGNYRIKYPSPAIDHGSNAALPVDAQDLDGDSDTTELLPMDRDSEARIINGTVDIGADEVDYVGICISYVSPYTVSASDTDDLATAVACANINPDADIINLTNSIYSFTSPSDFDTGIGDTALPRITSPITINGNGATLNRDSRSIDHWDFYEIYGVVRKFRLLTVDSGGNLTLNNVTISNGSAGSSCSVTSGVNMLLWGGPIYELMDKPIRSLLIRAGRTAPPNRF